MPMELKHDIDFQGDNLIQTYSQETGGIVQQCKMLRDNQAGKGKFGELVHVGRIPMALIPEIKKKYGIDIWNMKREEMQRLIQIIQSDYPLLMAAEGRFA